MTPRPLCPPGVAVVLFVIASSQAALAAVAPGRSQFHSGIRRASDEENRARIALGTHGQTQWIQKDLEEEPRDSEPNVEPSYVDESRENETDTGPGRLIRDDEPHILGEFFGTVIGFLIYTLFAALYLRNRASFYPTTQIIVEGGEEAFMEFRHGLCSCYERPLLSCIACLCPSLRMADTVYTMGILTSFWSAFFFLALIYASTQAATASSIAVIDAVGGTGRRMGLKLLALYAIQKFVDLLVFPLLGAALRGELRAKFRMKERDSGTLFWDACTWCWCSCCAIVQEARQVEDAVCASHPAVAQPIATSV